MTVLFEPLTIRHSSDLLRAMKERRAAIGLSGEEMDHKVGLTRGHTAKIENGLKPWGKAAFVVTPALTWLLQGLGLRLMLVDDRIARQFVAETEVKVGVDAYEPRDGRPVLYQSASLVSYEWPAATLQPD